MENAEVLKQDYLKKLGTLREGVSLKERTSFRIGGPARYLFSPASAEDLAEAVRLLKANQIPYYLLGGGSNLLVSSKGLEGVVIELGFNDFYPLDYPGSFYVGAGVSLPYLLGICLEQSLGGLEFLAGIPATMGGALATNASYKGKDIMSLVQKLKLLNTDDLSLSFVDKVLVQEGYHAPLEKCLIIGASIFLEPKDARAIKKEIRDNIAYRRAHQEVGVFCAGCIFKNPQGDKGAGRLIEEAGLKGKRYGGARISDKHANFIVNEKDASSSDVVFLIEEIREKVYNKSGVVLKEEIIRWGC